MPIDWFTVAAQAVNFLILVGLMKRFLYQPILHAIDAREERVAAKLADAEAKEAVAMEERDAFAQKNEDLDQQRAELLKQAADEADSERRRLLDEARKAADDMAAKRQEALSREAQFLNQEITACVRHEVFAIARKALKDLSDADLEDRITGVFIKRLDDLDAESRSRVADTLKPGAGSLLRSAFELSKEQRARIQSALNQAFAADIQLRFETVPNLVAGIEFSSNGQKVAWSIADYLISLEKGIGELLPVAPKAS